MGGLCLFLDPDICLPSDDFQSVPFDLSSLICSVFRDNFLVLDIFFEALNYETIEQKKAYDVAGLLGESIFNKVSLHIQSVPSVAELTCR